MSRCPKPPPATAPSAALALAVAAAAAVLSPAPAVAVTGWVERVSEKLVVGSADGFYQAQLGGLLDLDGYYIDANKPPGIIHPDDKFYFNPRLSLNLDAFAGERVYGFAKFRWDKGFDPGYAEGGQGRLDEYFVRLTVVPEHLDLQAGKFATVFGNYAGRHESWDSPFVSAPLPYEHFTTVLDQGVRPGPAAWLPLKDVPDNKKGWLPLIWGPAYTTGAAVLGSAGNLDYALEVKSRPLSSRPPVWDDTDFDHPTAAGRVGYRHGAAWTFGLSAAHGPYLHPDAAGLPPGRDIGDYDQLTLGADAAFARGHWQLWGELIYSRFDVPNVEEVEALAYYLEAKYKWNPTVYTAARWGQQFYGEIDDGAGGSEAWDRNVSRLELALGLRLQRNLQLKLQYGFANQYGEHEQGQQFAATQLTLRF